MFTLEKRFADEMIACAFSDDPNETCGMIVGRNGRIEKLIPTTNVAASPVRYEIDPLQQLRVMEEMDARRLDLVGIYHSHTHSPAYPSQTDIRHSGPWEGALFFIVSLQDHSNPHIRAFWIKNGQVQEETVEIIETSGIHDR